MKFCIHLKTFNTKIFAENEVDAVKKTQNKAGEQTRGQIIQDMAIKRELSSRRHSLLMRKFMKFAGFGTLALVAGVSGKLAYDQFYQKYDPRQGQYQSEVRIEYWKAQPEPPCLLPKISKNQAASIPEIFSLVPEGTYIFDNSNLPISYLLVRYQNNPEPRCLSLVQEVFDLIFGIGKAKAAGLYSGKFASELNFSQYPMRVEGYRANDPKHNEQLPPGAVLRLDGGSSIAISAGRGVCMHLVYDRLIVERISGIMTDDYMPYQVIFPDSTFIPQNLELSEPSHIFRKGSGYPLTLERIAAKIREKTPALWEQNIASIEETIYQLNMDRFELKQTRRNSHELAALVIGGESRMRFPKDWNVPDNW